MISKRAILWLALAAILAVSASCGKTDDTGDKKGPGAPEAASGGATWAPKGNEGNITGTIAFNGAAPTPKKLNMESDPVCAKGPGGTNEDTLVNDGKLQNVFVYVKSGLPSVTFPVPADEVVLDQKGCQYHPHVLGIQAKQKLKVVSSDPTAHNIHPTPKDNQEWNESQPPGAPPIIKTFARPEVLIPVKCNQHAWMKAWIGVLSHPYYAVTGKDGSFTIKGVPPGDYVVEAYHEKLGAKTMNVKVAEKADAKADFSFEAAAAYKPPSLRIEPALVLP